jgi:hypothetical protein
MKPPSRAVATLLAGRLTFEVILGAAHKAQPPPPPPPHVETPDFGSPYSVGNATHEMQWTTAASTRINLFDLVSARSGAK